jgi:hypothetical protein
MYNLAALLPRRRPEPRLIPLPCRRAFLPAGLQAVQAQSFLVEIRLPVHINGSPLLLAPYRAPVLQSGTTRHASLPLSDGNLGILRSGASPESPWRARSPHAAIITKSSAIIKSQLFALGAALATEPVHSTEGVRKLRGDLWSSQVRGAGHACVHRPAHSAPTRSSPTFFITATKLT